MTLPNVDYFRVSSLGPETCKRTFPGLSFIRSETPVCHRRRRRVEFRRLCCDLFTREYTGCFEVNVWDFKLKIHSKWKVFYNKRKKKSQ